MAFGTAFTCFVGPVTIGLYWKGAVKAGSIASMMSGLVVDPTWFLFVYKKFPASTNPLAWVYPVVSMLAVLLVLFFL